ncbi:MAG TPA: phosphoenolpyruvate--protein phosphotransferase [Candidatus Krumholzibacteria bacterium]|nr:phosphoenolpyruvate--protein phosphotransferase [Candidatus Krumholzibacteria bacterium]
MRTLRGIAASPGFAVAPLHVVRREELRVEGRALAPEDVVAEIGRFRAAVAAARDEISALVERLDRDLANGDAAILESQLLMLEDELLVGRAEALIEERRISADGALHEAATEILTRFDDLADDYLRERILDLRDVEARLLRTLQDCEDGDLTPPLEPCVIAADDLTPSDTAALAGGQVRGFLLGGGSRTSHVAILARSLGIPAVVGLGAALAKLRDGDLVALDGGLGEVTLDPEDEVLERYRALARESQDSGAKHAHLRDLPAVTPDDVRVSLLANIELPPELDLALAAGAEGVGLLRTEYLVFQHGTIPSEAEQYDVYAGVLNRLGGRPAVFRTLDVGGDKVVRYLGGRKESNPFLGWRGIRFLLANRALFKSQLRAIYRAAARGPLQLMFPMITGVDELRAARAVCRECCEELAAAGLEHDPDIPVGIMIETPSAAVAADLLARECDFFSVGTNDLIQYTLAMDRLNAQVAYLYQPLHPAVLRLLGQVADAAHAAGIPVGMCGEMASETRYAEVLLGLGFDSLSLHAAQIPKVKQVVRWTPRPEAEALVAELRRCGTAAEAEARLNAYLTEKKRRRGDG